MDLLQCDIWVHLGHPPDPAAEAPAGESAEQPQTTAMRRRFDRGGRRRADWPEDAGLSSCPGSGFENIQSLGALDSGDYCGSVRVAIAGSRPDARRARCSEIPTGAGARADADRKGGYNPPACG